MSPTFDSIRHFLPHRSVRTTLAILLMSVAGFAQVQNSLTPQRPIGRVRTAEGIRAWPAPLCPLCSADPLAVSFSRLDSTTALSFWGPTVTGDFNGDGKLDMVATSLTVSSQGIYFLSGNGDGTFSSPVLIFNAIGDIAAGDVDGDGKLDLVSTIGDQLYVFLGNGDGTFDPLPPPLPGPSPSTSLFLRDINGDGKLDLVGGLQNAGIAIALGNGDGTFGPFATFGLSGNSHATTIVAADFNGDGKVDLAAVGQLPPDYQSSVLSILLGNGDGTFGSPIGITVQNFAYGLAAGDFNRDGQVDLALPSYGSASISVLLGNGNGTFSPGGTFAVAQFPEYIAAADLDGDGVLDLAVDGVSSTLSVLHGNGDGTFGPMQDFPLLTAAGSPIIADFNLDGRPDIGSLDISGGTISVLLNTTANATETTTRLSASPNPSTLGQTVTLKATVSSASGQPSGKVIFYDGPTAIGIATLATGRASIAVSALGGGMHSITAAYQGIGGYWPSTSAPLHQVVSSSIQPTTLTLGASQNPATFGQPGTVTATVNSASGTPTGTVVFYDFFDSQEVGIWTVPLVNGQASISSSGLQAGPNFITATYQGDSKFGVSRSELTEIVTPATTTTSLKVTPTLAHPGQYVFLSASVSSEYGDPVSSAVQFRDNGRTIGPLSSGLRATFKTLGRHWITATYPGDADHNGSVSPAVALMIANGSSPSETKLVTSESPTLLGQPVTFTATVTSTAGKIPDGDPVIFYDAAKVLGTGSTSGGTASFTTSSLAVKTHAIKAVFPWDGTFKQSSGTVSQVVTKYPTTTTTPVSSLNPSAYGQAVTWTTSVTSNGPNPATGTVHFVGVGSATLNGGMATITRSWFKAGTHAVTAEYLGDSASAPSSSTALNQVVNPASTVTTITSSANPSPQGQAVTFTAKVISETGAHATGTVTFTAGSTTLGTVALNGIIASISTSSLPAGSTSITATYNGAADFSGSSGSVLQRVQ